jgi:hypothetical protein
MDQPFFFFFFFFFINKDLDLNPVPRLLKSSSEAIEIVASHPV